MGVEEEGRLVWVGGEGSPSSPEAARIRATDHAYVFGSGLYETVRTYHARPFALPEHLERLRRGASQLNFGPLPLADMENALRELAARRAPAESCLRLALSPGTQFPGWNTPLEGPIRWTAFAGPLAPFAPAVYERGVRCILASRPRWNPGGFVPAVKFASNADIRLAKKETEEAGAFEALLLNPGGQLAEASSSNVFLVIEKGVVTPHLAAGILDGVTRSFVLKLAGAAGLATEERAVSPGELDRAEEVFLTSTLKEVVPVVRIGGRTIGTGAPGIITDRLLGLYQELALESTRGDAA